MFQRVCRVGSCYKNQSVLGLQGECRIHLCVSISFDLLIREQSLRNHLPVSRRHETRIQVFFSPNVSVFVVQNVWLSCASLGMHIEFWTLDERDMWLYTVSFLVSLLFRCLQCRQTHFWLGN